MKAFKVAEARARFGELLDVAEGGESVSIERHGVLFTLRAESRSGPRDRAPSLIAWAHPDVSSGQWTWDLSNKGLRFRSRKRRK